MATRLKVRFGGARVVAALAVMCALAPRPSRAQNEPPPTDQSGLYVGTVGKATVYAHLNFYGDECGGRYAYGGIPTTGPGPEGGLGLKGKLGPGNALELIELFSSGQLVEQTGAFSGKVSAERTRIEGTWSNPSGKKRLPFELRLAARDAARIDQAGIRVDLVEFDPRVGPLAARAGEAVERDVQARLGELRARLVGPWNGGAPRVVVTYTVTFFTGDLVCVRVNVEEAGGSSVNHALLLRATGSEIEQVGAGALFAKGAAWKDRLARAAERLVVEDPWTPRRETYLPPRFDTLVVRSRCQLLVYLRPSKPEVSRAESGVPVPCEEVADILALPLSALARKAKR